MAAVAQDDIDLRIDPDDGDGYYRLYWTGGSTPYEVYRSTDPALVVAATNRLGETILQAWIDEPPPAGGPFFFQITSSCLPACVAGEICCYEVCCSLPNATPGCGGAGAGCVVESCDEDYWNLNGINADGCEFFCDTPEMTDFPDLLGTDENCDLVDGEVDNAIFVAKWGDDGNPGSLESPKLTIQAGLDSAAALGRRDVYVAAGLYFEKINMPAGVGAYGGYDSDFHARDIAIYETIVAGTDPTAALPGAVSFLSLTGLPSGTTVFDGFTVLAPDVATATDSTYGLYLVDSDQSVTIAHNRIHGGDGGDGARGADGTDGAAGTPGSPGMDALDLYATYGVSGHECSAAYHSPGGAGGSTICGPTPTNGGDGGGRICPAFDGSQTDPPVASEWGQAGSNGGGPGGSPGWDVYHQAYSCYGYETWGYLAGDPGADGAAGDNGGPGEGCFPASGSVVASLWVAQPAAAGADGGHASGGGGGGSGAGAWTHEMCDAYGYSNDNLGGSGGGGGAGGCAGTAGGPGQGGGGSFAIFTTWTAPPATVPTIVDNTIYTGFGGRGGDGGAGGLGGEAGAGGPGGASIEFIFEPDPVYPSFAGGHGGSGGRGGHGGGGGGGCGGPAYGIFAWNQGAANLDAWSFGNLIITSGAGGAGGQGGYSLGNPGNAGTDGEHAETSF
jgi:hypothetical protein